MFFGGVCLTVVRGAGETCFLIGVTVLCVSVHRSFWFWLENSAKSLRNWFDRDGVWDFMLR